MGRAISLGLAAAGYDVVVGFHSSEAPAREVRELIESAGRRCVLVKGDLADPSTAHELAEAAREGFGRLDLLVNSASNFHGTAVLDTDADEWDAILDVNLRAPHLLVRACADLLSASGGSVVNISDHMGVKPWVRYGAHSVSKAALVHLTRVQAKALAPEVRVNSVAPGLVLPPEGLSEKEIEAEAAATLLERAGSPRDVVEAILYLARADYVTGQLLVVDGGGVIK